MLEEEAPIVGGQEEIVKLKRRRLSNLRHNFVQQQIYKTLHKAECNLHWFLCR